MGSTTHSSYAFDDGEKGTCRGVYVAVGNRRTLARPAGQDRGTIRSRLGAEERQGEPVADTDPLSANELRKDPPGPMNVGA